MTDSSELVCRCTSRMGGYIYNDDTDSVFYGMWVHSECGHPSRPNRISSGLRGVMITRADRLVTKVINDDNR